MTHRENWKIQHEKLHVKHRGHEAMHAEMVLILIAALLVAQVVLVQWKQRHRRSYSDATVGTPLDREPLRVVTAEEDMWKNYMKYAASLILGVPFYFGMEIFQMMVYKWFLLIYKLSYAVGVVGYLAIVFTMFGFNVFFRIKAKDSMDVGIILLFYGMIIKELENSILKNIPLYRGT